MAEESEKRIETLLEVLPPAVAKRPEEMTALELLQETGRKGLLACYDMVDRYDCEQDVKERRLIADITGQTVRAVLKVAEDQFKAQQADRLGELLAALKEARKG